MPPARIAQFQKMPLTQHDGGSPPELCEEVTLISIPTSDPLCPIDSTNIYLASTVPDIIQDTTEISAKQTKISALLELTF